MSVLSVPSLDSFLPSFADEFYSSAISAALDTPHARV
jgi:hypothetical protein